MPCRSRVRQPIRGCADRRGIALLSVVVVLSTLLIVGVLFTYTVDLDLKASRYYRDAGAAEQFALEGLHRAVAELQYDVWGVNESRAFKLADSGQRLDDAAYRSPFRNSAPIVAARSRWRRSVETLGRGGNRLSVLTDYRWLEKSTQGRARTPHDPATKWMHSAATYHDEFLPEGSDNNDHWELGLHINPGDIYFEGEPPRSLRQDERGGAGAVYGSSFWVPYRNRPWDREWDYIDTRINGDSFYKIFRFELVDPATRVSSYAGVQADGLPSGKGEWLRMKTHMGMAAFPGGYKRDSRGGAVNLNQVNNNYTFESYFAQSSPDPQAPYVSFHYKDSKWIYVYDDRQLPRGRYAVLVWPDCGTPNANYQFSWKDYTAAGGWSDGVTRHMANYLQLLDTAFNPRGGPIGLKGYLKPGQANSWSEVVGADIIKSNQVVDPPGVETAWHLALSERLREPIGIKGPFGSRAELNMLIRKYGFDPHAVSAEELEHDAELISSLQTVWGYQNLMGPHWEADRIILDTQGYTNKADRLERSVGPDGVARFLPTSYLASSRTRELIGKTLDRLRYYWGPDDEREGKYTPYSLLQAGSGLNTASAAPDLGGRPLREKYPGHEAASAKSAFFSYLASAPFRIHNGWSTYGEKSRVGWATDTSRLSTPLLRSPRLGEIQATHTFHWPFGLVINETGLIFRGGRNNVVNTLRDALAKKKCWGWPDPPLDKGEARFGDGTNGVPAPGPAEELIKLSIYGFVEITSHGILGANWWSAYWRYRGRPTEAADPSIGLYVSRDGRTWSRDVLDDAATVVVSVSSLSESLRNPQYRLDRAAIDRIFVDKTMGRDPAHNPIAVNPRQFAQAPGVDMWKRAMNDPVQGQRVQWLFENCVVWVRDDAHYRWQSGGVDEGWVRRRPSNYALVLYDSSKFQGKYVALGIRSKDGAVQNRLLDYVELPGDLQDGWSCHDFLNNQHPAQWVRTDNRVFEDHWPARPATHSCYATPGWRGLATDDKRWLDGVNHNFVMHYLPGADAWPNPYDIANSYQRFKAYDSEGHGSRSRPHIAGPSAQSALDSSWIAAGILAFQQYIISANTTGVVPLNQRGRLLTVPLGFFPRNEPSALAGRRPDPFLRVWGDLMRVAPVERFFTTGYLGLNTPKHGEYSIYDGFDNNLDGRVDDLTPLPRDREGKTSWYAGLGLSGRVEGHFVGDRGCIGPVNLNEIAHPATLWYVGFGVGDGGFRTRAERNFDAHFRRTEMLHQMVVLGRKPLKGYTCWADYRTRSAMGDLGNRGGHSVDEMDDLPYHASVWYENLFADADGAHIAFGGAAGQQHRESRPVARRLYVGNSPVYTVYVRAQTLDEAERPLAEMKVRCTVERTWNGQTNLLDFKWIPSDVSIRR